MTASSILQQFADTSATTGGVIDIFTRYNGSFDITVNGNKTMIDDMN